MRPSSSVVVWSAVLAAVALRAQPTVPPPPEHFSGTAINLGSVGLRGSAPIDVVILGWSAGEERASLANALSSRGADGLLDLLRGRPTRGYVWTAREAYPLRLTWTETVGDGWRRVIVVTDKPITFHETPLRRSAFRYPFTLIEMRLNIDGTGHGKLSVTAPIIVGPGGSLELANYDAEPVHLASIRSVNPPT
jgi:hypothetical protein